MCFGCSKEPSHWDGSFEYSQHMFGWEIKKIIFQYAFFSGGLRIACIFQACAIIACTYCHDILPDFWVCRSIEWLSPVSLGIGSGFTVSIVTCNEICK